MKFLSVKWVPSLSLAYVVCALMLPGCQGGGDNRKVVPVQGKVMADGTPMKVGTVTFMPDKDKGNTATASASGMIQADGTYKLTFEGKDGAPLGWYNVGVSPHGMGADPANSPKEAIVNSKYQMPGTSGISIQVVESPAAGAYDINVTK